MSNVRLIPVILLPVSRVPELIQPNADDTNNSGANVSGDAKTIQDTDTYMSDDDKNCMKWITGAVAAAGCCVAGAFAPNPWSTLLGLGGVGGALKTIADCPCKGNLSEQERDGMPGNDKPPEVIVVER